MDLENTNLDRINEILSIIKDDLLRKEYLQSKRIAKDWFKKKVAEAIKWLIVYKLNHLQITLPSFDSKILEKIFRGFLI